MRRARRKNLSLGPMEQRGRAIHALICPSVQTTIHSSVHHVTSHPMN